jgi:hypothetical protein
MQLLLYRVKDNLFEFYPWISKYNIILLVWEDIKINPLLLMAIDINIGIYDIGNGISFL